MQKRIESFVMYEKSVDEHKLVVSHGCSIRGHRGEQVGALRVQYISERVLLLRVSSGRISPPNYYIIGEKRWYGLPSCRQVKSSFRLSSGEL